MSAAPAPFTVAAEPAASVAGAIDSVVASLPVSLAHARHEVDADLVAVDGHDGWGERASIAAANGARGIVVIDPVRAEAVDPGATIVVVERSFASHPGVQEARLHVHRAGHDSLVEVRLDVSHDDDLQRSLMDALALARAVTGRGVSAARILSRTPHQVTVRGMLVNEQPVLITVTATDARPRAATVRLLGSDAAVEVAIPAAAAARPAQVTVTGADGATLLPTRYETAHRGSWRRLIAAVSGTGTTPLPDLEELAEDGEVVDRALAEHPPAPGRS